MNKPRVYLIRIDHHNGLMNLETTLPIPEGCAFLQAHGQGRVVGFLTREWLRPLRAAIIHLDYPGLTMEYEVPPSHTTGGPLSVSSPPLFSRPLSHLAQCGFLSSMSGVSAFQPNAWR